MVTEEKVDQIVCVLLGRPASRGLVEEAIELALKHEARLTFLLVIEAEFLARAAPTMSPLRVVYEQLEEIGEFTLLMLCQQARHRGVAEVDSIIRRGKLEKRLLKFAEETEADLILLTNPGPGSGRSSFTDEEFAELVGRIGRTGGFKVLEVKEPQAEEG
jgi:nucleotide-binding universal stress UspA family protein